MKIVTVIPLSQGIYKEDLTYFTSKNIEPGTIVSIPVRKQIIDAVVVSTEDLISSKSLVKSSAFHLRKIEKIKGPLPISPEFFKAAMEAKKYFAGTSGATLYSLLPKIFLDEYEHLKKAVERKIPKMSNLKQDNLVFQAPLEERIAFYKTFIRESFAKKSSVFICLPTINEIEKFAETLSKGVEEYSFVFHGNVADKEIIRRFNGAITTEHPVLIIGTGSYLFIPRHDMATIIVERESSAAYKLMTRPYADIRTFAEILSKELKVKLIFADTFLRVETLWKHFEGEFSELNSLSYSLPRSIKREIIDMRKEKEENAKAGSKKFPILSSAVKALVQEAVENKKNVFLFALRKGLAPITACNDCGNTVVCDFCNAPLVLYGKEGSTRIFACNKCKKKKKSEMTCENCHSWNLVPLGIGTEIVYEELKKLFPKQSIFKIDKETITTKKQGQKIAEQFYKNPGSILVGTEMALFYLKEKVEHTAVVSLDSLMSIPSFKMNEKILNLLLALESYTEKKLVIQTKNPDEKILQSIVGGNLLQFFRDELADRKKFKYPPYKTLIKINCRDSKEKIEMIKEKAAELFAEYAPDIFQAFIAKTRGLYAINIVLKLDRNIWSSEALYGKDGLDQKLSDTLLSLPPSWSVHVDPDDLL